MTQHFPPATKKGKAPVGTHPIIHSIKGKGVIAEKLEVKKSTPQELAAGACKLGRLLLEPFGLEPCGAALHHHTPKFSAAIAKFEEALLLQPTSGTEHDAYLGIGSAYVLMIKYSCGFQGVKTFGKENADRHRNSAKTQKHAELATGNLAKALSLQPKNTVPHYWLGMLHFYLEKYDEALADFKLVHEADLATKERRKMHLMLAAMHILGNRLAEGFEEIRIAMRHADLIHKKDENASRDYMEICKWCHRLKISMADAIAGRNAPVKEKPNEHAEGKKYEPQERAPASGGKQSAGPAASQELLESEKKLGKAVMLFKRKYDENQRKLGVEDTDLIVEGLGGSSITLKGRDRISGKEELFATAGMDEAGNFTLSIGSVRMVMNGTAMVADMLWAFLLAQNEGHEYQLSGDLFFSTIYQDVVVRVALAALEKSKGELPGLTLELNFVQRKAIYRSGESSGSLGFDSLIGSPNLIIKDWIAYAADVTSQKIVQSLKAGKE